MRLLCVNSVFIQDDLTKYIDENLESIMTVRKITAIGFMLFAIFFGAGNLIFPPNAGWLSGGNFFPAIIGFVITGVGLPLLGIIAGSFSEEGFITETKRIGVIFSVVFMVAIYLTIGPFFAIPRTATVSYEMALVPFIRNEGGLLHGLFLSIAEGLKSMFYAADASVLATDLVGKVGLFFYSVFFFIVVFWLSFNPTKIVDRVGQILTPALLITMLVLIVLAIFQLNTPIEAVDPSYQAAPFAKGFVEGYQTMDTIAAVAFSIIVLKAVRAYGITNQKDLFKYSSYAAVIAGVALGLIYIALGWVGNHFPIDEAQFALQQQDRGTYILTQVSRMTLGLPGQFLLGIIVGLACLTTAIGLIVSISSYFHSLMPRLSYKQYAIIFTLISFGLANQGLSSIIKGAIPVLLIVYPLTITLIVLIFIDKLLVPLDKVELRITTYVVLFISVSSVFFPTAGFVQMLPLHDISMGWVVPGVVAFLVAIHINNNILLKRAVRNQNKEHKIAQIVE